MKALTTKQRKFVKALVKTGNKTQAYREVYDTNGTPNTQAVEAYRISNKPHVKSAIEKALDNAGVNEQWVIDKHKDLADNSDNDMVRTKNVEDLGQILRIYPNKGGASVDINKEGVTVSWGDDE